MSRSADWYFDFISPFAYLQFLQFEKLPPDLKVNLKPVLFAGLLGHWDQKGPAEIPAKRIQTYRTCHWLATQMGVAYKTPPAHPFNPLVPLRLAIALGVTRDAVAAIYDHIWGQGNDGQSADSFRALASAHGIPNLEAAIGEPAVKGQLRANTEEAIARGIFGVPTFLVDDQLFWGNDATGMLLDYLADPTAFTEGEMARISDLPIATQRKQSRL
ncbi:MAG: 2-hydroxychromene-2-carboxylate isomerase [Alphaproteobacteria bacterium]